MRFATTIVLGSVAVIIGIGGLTSVVAAQLVENDARAALDAELGRGGAVIEAVVARRQSLFAANAKVVAEEPRLKAIVATEDIDRATVLDVSRELRKAVGSELFLLTDRDGALLVDMADPDAAGFDLRTKPVVADALAQGTGQGVWMAEGQAYQMASRRLSFGETAVGVLVVGWPIDDALAEAAAAQTGGAVTLLVDGQPLASSLTPEHRGALPPDRSSSEGVPVTLELEGSAHRAVFGRVAGDDRLGYLVMRSLDDALETSRRLVRLIYGIGAGAILVALLLALWLSWRLSQPLGRLVEFTRDIAAGRLGGRLRPSGPRELEVLGEAMNQMSSQLAEYAEQRAAKDRLAREMEIATRIQTSILPAEPSIPRYSVAASMDTATEVGGDYYDVVHTDDVGWVGIGDVAGHGLPAGVVMLMVQSATGILVRSHPDQTPAALVTRLNAFLFDNIRVRLVQDEHVTFTLLRCAADGEVLFAGAHEEIVVLRRASGRVERLRTPGPWLGVLQDITHVTRDQTCRLEPGDLMVLYSDGLTEAMNDTREQFGMDRLCALVEAEAGRSPAELVAHIRETIGSWCPEPVDDVTVVALRYDGPESEIETEAG